ncbi:unnamed protein product, partial [Meganyctiphanes norvegica]
QNLPPLSKRICWFFNQECGCKKGSVCDHLHICFECNGEHTQLECTGNDGSDIISEPKTTENSEKTSLPTVESKGSDSSDDKFVKEKLQDVKSLYETAQSNVWDAESEGVLQRISGTRYNCLICQCRISGIAYIDEHMKGKNHQDKLKTLPPISARMCCYFNTEEGCRKGMSCNFLHKTLEWAENWIKSGLSKKEPIELGLSEKEHLASLQAVVIRSYISKVPGDLDLAVGEIVMVTLRRSNGWCKGTNGKGKSGHFPSKNIDILEEKKSSSENLIYDPLKHEYSTSDKKDDLSEKTETDKLLESLENGIVVVTDNVYHCSICEVNSPGFLCLRWHVESKEHKDNMKNIDVRAEIKEIFASEDNSFKYGLKHVKKKGLNTLCTLCNVKILKIKNHLRSPVHKNKLQNLILETTTTTSLPIDNVNCTLSNDNKQSITSSPDISSSYGDKKLAEDDRTLVSSDGGKNQKNKFALEEKEKDELVIAAIIKKTPSGSLLCTRCKFASKSMKNTEKHVNQMHKKYLEIVKKEIKQKKNIENTSLQNIENQEKVIDKESKDVMKDVKDVKKEVQQTIIPKDTTIQNIDNQEKVINKESKDVVKKEVKPNINLENNTIQSIEEQEKVINKEVKDSDLKNKKKLDTIDRKILIKLLADAGGLKSRIAKNTLQPQKTLVRIKNVTVGQVLAAIAMNFPYEYIANWIRKGSQFTEALKLQLSLYEFLLKYICENIVSNDVMKWMDLLNYKYVGPENKEGWAMIFGSMPDVCKDINVEDFKVSCSVVSKEKYELEPEKENSIMSEQKSKSFYDNSNKYEELKEIENSRLSEKKTVSSNDISNSNKQEGIPETEKCTLNNQDMQKEISLEEEFDFDPSFLFEDDDDDEEEEKEEKDEVDEQLIENDGKKPIIEEIKENTVENERKSELGKKEDSKEKYCEKITDDLFSIEEEELDYEMDDADE